VETYAGQAEGNRDCQGEEFSAELWSNPISDEDLDNSTGIDCMRLCYFTETCFAVVVLNHKCFLKNDLCFANLREAPGAILGGTYTSITALCFLVPSFLALNYMCRDNCWKGFILI
jgi:hypothetical protein